MFYQLLHLRQDEYSNGRIALSVSHCKDHVIIVYNNILRVVDDVSHICAHNLCNEYLKAVFRWLESVLVTTVVHSSSVWPNTETDLVHTKVYSDNLFFSSRRNFLSISGVSSIDVDDQRMLWLVYIWMQNKIHHNDKNTLIQTKHRRMDRQISLVFLKSVCI